MRRLPLSSLGRERRQQFLLQLHLLLRLRQPAAVDQEDVLDALAQRDDPRRLHVFDAEGNAAISAGGAEDVFRVDTPPQ